jgi:hypothetical protein
MIMNSEWVGIWNEAFVTYLKISGDSPGETKGNHELFRIAGRTAEIRIGYQPITNQCKTHLYAK